MIQQGEDAGIKSDPAISTDVLSLRETLVYGLKGIAAYADHAEILGVKDSRVYGFIHEALAATLKKDLTVDDWLKLILKCGEINLLAMELLILYGQNYFQSISGRASGMYSIT